MKHHLLIIGALCAFSLLWATSGHAAVNLGEVAPDFSLPDPDGEWHQLTDHVGSIVVLEWVNYSCPQVQKHYDAGAMQELQKRYSKQGVVWLSINSSPEGSEGYLAPEDAAKTLKSKRASPTALLLDEKGGVAKEYDARTTPQIFIIGMDGKVAYIGAVDDRPDPEQSAVDVTHSYIANALDALLAGQALTMSYVNPYGCDIQRGPAEASPVILPDTVPAPTGSDTPPDPEARRAPAQNSFSSGKK